MKSDYSTGSRSLPGESTTLDRTDDDESLDFKVLGIRLNTCSLLPKLDDLRILAHTTSVAAIGITELWLAGSVSDAEVEIPGYIIVRYDRSHTGTGVCMYTEGHCLQPNN